MNTLSYGCSVFLFWAACVGGWITHVIRCVEADYTAFLFLGIFIPPVGVIHGWIVWLT